MTARTSHRVGLITAIVVMASWAAWASSLTNQVRLSTADVAGLAKGDAGAGTSGVAGIQTTVLSGDPTTV
jgi:hypothetical protein